MKRIAVVAGVIYNADQSEVLLALRPAHKHQGNLWEFPGGKIENSESGEAALVRELHEELGISALECQHFMALDFDYPDKSVNLDIWQVLKYEGTPSGREQQDIRWVSVANLKGYNFPAANCAIVDKLQQQIRHVSVEQAASIAHATH